MIGPMYLRHRYYQYWSGLTDGLIDDRQTAKAEETHLFGYDFQEAYDLTEDWEPTISEEMAAMFS